MTPARRYLIVTLGSAGDLHPSLALGRSLRQLGHDVEVMTNGPYREAVEFEGLRFSALCSREDHERAASHPDLWHPIKGFGVLWRYLAVPAIEPVRRRVEAFLGEDPVGSGAVEARGGEALPDGGFTPPQEGASSSPPSGRVLASPLAVGARLARSVRRFPLCSLYTAPANLRSVSDPMYLGAWRVPTAFPPFLRECLWWGLDRWKLEPMAGPALARSWEKLGVGAPRQSTFGRWIHSPDGGVTLFPDWFCARRPDWPDGIEMGAFPLFEASGTDGLSPALDAFLDAGARPVVIFPGSIAGETGIGLVRIALTACRALGLRAVVLGLSDAGWQAAIAGLAVDSVHRCDHAPLSRLLPRGRVFVHHGGVGSCAQGLYQRIPQLIHPHAFDQFDNAERVEREGGGRMVLGGSGFRTRFLALLEDLSGGGAGAILDRTRGGALAPDSTSTMPIVLDALQRWETRVSP
jgi:rhamnosyltransferase subunit B